MSNDYEASEYEVGYGKPPKANQFKPGQSGNPKGRPKGRQNFRTIVTELLNSKITVTENGKQTKVSFGEALVKKMAGKALKGSVPDLLKFAEFVDRYSPPDDQQEVGHTTRYLMFIDSDGNGRPADPEYVESIMNYPNGNTVDRPSETSNSDEPETDELDPDPIEAEWKAWGLDDEP